ncbi:hypothetical protein QI177_08380 [Staphylococcus saprophyticus]|uniref:hypothetical protein n=1 Tax=Staphylococcus saprophyticus TaxID=29385 RepID=UPI002970A6F5|nr:hypothetical protein [Staphylococcus saprophyticus]MDW4223589.1 hypothetical protein [Staphylococcus saprophyticus]
MKELSLLMKNNIVVILFVFILSLFLGSLALKFGQENSFEIALLFLGLFATFGGAYWGAKISGENSKEIFKQDLKLRNIENNITGNIGVLRNIEKIKIEIDENNKLNDNNETNKYYIQSNFLDSSKHIEKMDKIAEEIKGHHIDKASLIINIDFDGLYENVKALKKIKNDLFEYKLREEMCNKFLEDGEKLNFPLPEWGDFSVIKSEKICIPIVVGVEPDNKYVSIDDFYMKNQNIFDNAKKDIMIEMKKITKSYDNMKYKSRKDLKEQFNILFDES